MKRCKNYDRKLPQNLLDFHNVSNDEHALSSKVYIYIICKDILIHNAYKICMTDGSRLNRSRWKHRKFQCWLIFYVANRRWDQCDASFIRASTYRVSYTTDIMIFRYIYGSVIQLRFLLMQQYFIVYCMSFQYPPTTLQQVSLFTLQLFSYSNVLRHIELYVRHKTIPLQIFILVIYDQPCTCRKRNIFILPPVSLDTFLFNVTTLESRTLMSYFNKNSVC